MGKQVEIIIDGKQVIADEEQTVIQVLIDKKVDIPHLCYHKSLGSIETCDTCVVQINGEIQRACGTYVRENRGRSILLLALKGVGSKSKDK